MKGCHILSSGCSREGKQALSFRVSGVCLSAHRAPGISLGCLFCIRKGGSATAAIPGKTFCLALRFYPVPPLRNVDYSVFLASGIAGLWSREGCGAGPNQHSVVTSTGASATAGIPNRIPPCPALRLYPGLQVPVSSMTYRRSPPTPRQVLPQQAIFFQHPGMKIEKSGGVYGLTFFSLLSPPSLKTSPIPRRLANPSFSRLWGLGAGGSGP